MYNAGVDREVAVAQLSIIDGAWQESPDNLAIFDEGARGTLYLLTEVAGEPDGRDALARELVETARRTYAASRGSIVLGLAQALRDANNLFYNINADLPPEARRIAGLTAVVLRGIELFILQGGPGLTCLVRGTGLARYPGESPWYDPDDQIGDFTTPGTVPLGMRREFTPDVFHLTLQPGDTFLLATRSLVHLLTDEELLDSVARRHPDEIVDTLEDVAGAADLSAIAVHLISSLDTVPAVAASGQGEVMRQIPPLPETDEEALPLPFYRHPSAVTDQAGDEQDEEHDGTEPSTDDVMPSAEELAYQQAREEEENERRRRQAQQAQVQRAQLTGSVLSGLAGVVGGIAGVVGQIDWTRIGAAFDRAISTVLRAFALVVIFAVRAFLPGAPDEGRPVSLTPAKSNLQTAWRLAALLLPVLLLVLGGYAWISYRAEAQQRTNAQVTQYINQANALIDAAKRLAPTDKVAARDSYQKAMALAKQAQQLVPNNPTPRTVYFNAQDAFDQLNGISVLFSFVKFATYSDPKSNATRIVSHLPDVFVFDRGTQRIYRYAMNETGTAVAAVAGDGIILKTGDKIGERTVGELVDILWLDSGRLVALERTGLFLLYDPVKSSWTARAANDGSQWARVTMAMSYTGNLYLLDPSRNQIWKYVASADGVWSSAVTYFVPGVNVDLSSVVDMAIDGDVWVLRADGSVWRFTSGKLADFQPRDVDIPVAKPTALVTNQQMSGLYIADGGNQRIVQFDKVSGKFMRQFKPRGEASDAFSALKAIAVDETNKKFFFLNGNQVYLANIPQ